MALDLTHCKDEELAFLVFATERWEDSDTREQNFNSVFAEAVHKIQNLVHKEWTIRNLNYKQFVQNVDEFCRRCGAGVGKFRRAGEGTCPSCQGR